VLLAKLCISLSCLLGQSMMQVPDMAETGVVDMRKGESPIVVEGN
jgi:hypothetical protein